MDKESVERLRFDRRLQRRTGWLETTDMEAHLDALPDVSEKMTTGADDEAVAAAPETSTENAGGEFRADSVPGSIANDLGGDSGTGGF